jgi:hypothetical protein
MQTGDRLLTSPISMLRDYFPLKNKPDRLYI